MITTKEILIKTKEYLEINGWRQGSFSLSEWQERKKEDKISLCLQDALCMIIIIHGKPNSIEEYFQMVEPVLHLCTMGRYGENLRWWNDTFATEKDVFETLDKAIAACETNASE
jgi:hypothetical protein